LRKWDQGGGMFVLGANPILNSIPEKVYSGENEQNKPRDYRTIALDWSTNSYSIFNYEKTGEAFYLINAVFHAVHQDKSISNTVKDQFDKAIKSGGGDSPFLGFIRFDQNGGLVETKHMGKNGKVSVSLPNLIDNLGKDKSGKESFALFFQSGKSSDNSVEYYRVSFTPTLNNKIENVRVDVIPDIVRYSLPPEQKKPAPLKR
jgi:hypothetical protein